MMRLVDQSGWGDLQNPRRQDLWHRGHGREPAAWHEERLGV